MLGVQSHLNNSEVVFTSSKMLLSIYIYRYIHIYIHIHINIHIYIYIYQYCNNTTVRQPFSPTLFYTVIIVNFCSVWMLSSYYFISMYFIHLIVDVFWVSAAKRTEEPGHMLQYMHHKYCDYGTSCCCHLDDTQSTAQMCLLYSGIRAWSHKISIPPIPNLQIWLFFVMSFGLYCVIFTSESPIDCFGKWFSLMRNLMRPDISEGNMRCGLPWVSRHALLSHTSVYVKRFKRSSSSSEHLVLCQLKRSWRLWVGIAGYSLNAP